MGRPLFSKAFQTEPLVRESEPPCQYQKWSYINAFDPDSDEFFESDHAVYEAFVDHVPTEHSEDDDEVERDMVVIRMGSLSPVSSEDSVSDRASLMAVGPDPAQYFTEAYHRQMSDVDPSLRAHLATRGSLVDTPVQGETSVESVEANFSQRVLQAPDAPQQATSTLPSHPLHLEIRDELPLPPASTPIPVPAPSYHRSASVEDFSIPSFYHQNSPMTPPRHSAFHRFSPSPPPTVSPRIYTWASRRQAYSPAGTSPFTSTAARMSHTHISPALVRVHGA